MSSKARSLTLKIVSKQLVLAASATLAALLVSVVSISADTTPHSPGWAVLSVEDYRALHAKAFPLEREPEPPPVEATLTRVDYELRINGDLASGRASLTVDVLKDGWVRVPIPGGLLVREARLDGRPVSLLPASPGKSNAQLSALLSHPGRAILQLEIALPVASTAGEETIVLPSTTSGITRASVQLPRQGVDLRLTGGLLSENSESAAESKWTAYGEGQAPLTFTWRRKTEDHRATQPLRLRGSLTELLGLGEDTTSINTEVRLEVTQGAAHEVSIRVPGNVTVNQVLGAMVADWQVKSGALTVAFLENVDQSARFVISGETHCPREGQMDIPLLRLENADRETGGVAVEVLGAGEIKDLKSAGLEVADAADLGELVASRQSPMLAALRFRAGDAKLVRSLSIDVARYTPQAVLMANVSEARYQVLLTSEGKTLVDARYAVRNNQRNFLKITLPSGATLWSASLEGKPVRPGQAPDGGLLLPLDKTRSGEESPEFAVEIVYISRGTTWTDKGQFNLALPALDLPVSRTGLLLYHPPLFKVTTEPGTFRTAPYEAPVSVAINSTGSTPGIAAGFGGAIAAGSAGGVAGGVPSTGANVVPPPPPASAPSAGLDARSDYKVMAAVTAPQVGTNSLVEKFRADSLAGKRAGILPIPVSFPVFGPSIYLVSELTAENQGPSAELSYQREKKAGVK